MDQELGDVSRKIFKWGVGAMVKGLRLNKASRFSCAVSEALSPLYTVRWMEKKFVFYCPTAITRWRAESMFTKEPETIEWINTFKPGEVLFDIGANIGLYSTYAGSCGVRVIAFEPESQNYAVLNRNILLNKLEDRVQCLSIALSDKDAIDYLYIPRFESGGAMNNFGENKGVDHQEFQACFKQGGVSFSLDSLLAKLNVPFPDHIKIDVDGIEDKIIRGAEKTLRDDRLKSLSIEFNEALPESTVLAKRIESGGLRFHHKKHAPIFDKGRFSNIFNYVFVRP